MDRYVKLHFPFLISLQEFNFSEVKLVDVPPPHGTEVEPRVEEVMETEETKSIQDEPEDDEQVTKIGNLER